MLSHPHLAILHASHARPSHAVPRHAGLSGSDGFCPNPSRPPWPLRHRNTSPATAVSSPHAPRPMPQCLHVSVSQHRCSPRPAPRVPASSRAPAARARHRRLSAASRTPSAVCCDPAPPPSENRNRQSSYNTQ